MGCRLDNHLGKTRWKFYVCLELVKVTEMKIIGPDPVIVKNGPDNVIGVKKHNTGLARKDTGRVLF